MKAGIQKCMFYLTENTNDVHDQDSSVNNASTIVIYS